MVLAGYMRILKGVLGHAEAIRTPANVPVHRHAAFERELACIQTDLASHSSTLSELLNVSSDVRSTVSNLTLLVLFGADVHTNIR
jgi:hypothetical protein